jgi:phosphate transport system substrate-binding protein
MNKKIIILALIIILSTAISYDYYVKQSELQGTIKISGAWALYPMMVKWAEEFQKIYPKVRIDISAGGAGKGMTDVLGGLVDIGMVSREIYPDEVDQGALAIAVVKDAVVATVSQNNPVLNDLLTKGITKKAFMSIWVFGNATTWGDIVDRPEVTSRINVYTRSDACGAADTWAKYLGIQQEELLGVGVYGDPGLAEAVRNDQQGIGYNNLNYAYDNSTGIAIEGLVVVPIDLNENSHVDENEDFYATKLEFVEAVATGSYPSPPARELYVVAKNQFNDLTKQFARWILTQGQQYVSQTGYVGLSQERLTEEAQKLG